MTLSFSTHINGQPTHFVGKIWDSLYNQGFNDSHYSRYQMKWLEKFGTGGMDDDLPNKRNPKIHTIRADKSNRWKPGNKIHFVIKNRTPNRFQFAPIVTCQSIQHIEIKWVEETNPYTRFTMIAGVFVDGILIGCAYYRNGKLDSYDHTVNEIATNDGFNDVDDFFSWFSQNFTGKIIHWTDYQY